MTYDEWNLVIARRFFQETQAGKKVFLSVDDELLQELGGSVGKADFIAAIKIGPAAARRPGLSLCTQARNTYEEWRTRPSNVPAYLAYLAFFVLAASQEGESGHEGYYKRLHRLLGEELTNRPPPNFYEMWALWDDLEEWANDENGGRLGIVNCDFAHTWPHVGLPRAQIVLTERERANLPELFAAAELEPHSPPAAEELASLCRRHGAGRLEARTIRRLAREGTDDEELRALTVEAILDELRSWDGHATDGDGVLAGYHILRLNLKIQDRLSGKCQSRFVVQDSETFPDGEFSVNFQQSGETMRLGPCNPSWSVLKSNTGAVTDASTLPWNASVRLTVENIVFRFPQRRVRVLSKGEFERIEGLIEVNRLDPHREFYVLAYEETASTINEWACRAVKNWQEILLRSGLSRGWRLFRGDSADTKIQAPAEFPALRSDSQLRILFVDGIKTEPMSRRYFDFAAPKIRIEGLTAESTVRINRTTIAAEAGDVTIQPSACELEASNRVSVIVDEEESRFACFQIQSSKEISWRKQATWTTLSSSVSGEWQAPLARADGGYVHDFLPPQLILALERSADLIGPRVGQISTIPTEPLPSTWSPVWMIEHGRTNRRVIFCGASIADCQPLSAPSPDSRKTREWKRVLWNERMRLTGPSAGPLVTLWRQYRDAAKNV